MSKLKCNDCGTVFDGTLECCPGCGCPAQSCVVVEEATANTVRNCDDGSKSYQNYYYTDFDWFEKFTSDPGILTSLMDVPFLKWLFAPWHISDADDTLNHKIANDIFFLYNRFWKLFVYSGVWAFFKAVPFIIAYILLIIIPLYLIHSNEAYQLYCVIMPLLSIALFIVYVWFSWIGFGKSCKRYGIPFIAALRHLYITVSNDIKDNLR